MNPIFEQLEAATRRLNMTGDRATELIRATNERLQKVGAGVEYWPEPDAFVLRSKYPALPEEVEERHGAASRYDEVLGYAKLGSWQLTMRVYRFVPNEYANLPEDFDGEDDPSPLLAADRELRIKAAAMLPKFLEAYAAHLQKVADQLPDSK